jgi:glycosyltransferase involved in cell wall biosynthesis
MSEPEVSIIIPCYNIERHLPKCIDSVLNQTYSNFELLLLNDGSSDNTLQICEEFKAKDSRVRVFSHQNKGVSYTRNRGIDLTKGESIMFIDGDDFVKPDYVEILSGAFENLNWTICGMIKIPERKDDNSKKTLEFIKSNSTQDLNVDDFMRLIEFHLFSSPYCKIYSKHLIDKYNIRFDESLSYQEDLLFNINYSQYIDKVIILDYYGYYYVEHKISSTRRFHKNFDHINILYNNLNNLVFNKKDKMILQEFVFQTSLRKISNIFHKDSFRKNKDKLFELKETLDSNYFKFSSNYILKSDLNIFLKILLKLKKPKLIFYYFKIRSKI